MVSLIEFHLNLNTFMKKLFLLLILSFFSVHSLAESCPDGSEPIKSVSDDGSYYVFNCDGANEAPSYNTDSSNTDRKSVV